MLTRKHRLAPLIRERDLSTTGFREALRGIADEYTYQEDEDGDPIDESDREYFFTDWFGPCDVIPAAFRIVRSNTGRGVWDLTVEVYEVENCRELPEHKWEQYGWMADGEGPHFELHILDRYDHEIIIPGDVLMGFYVFPNCRHKKNGKC